MLDPWIIDAIRRREEERKQEEHRLPLYREPDENIEESPYSERGVWVFDLCQRS